MNLQLAPEQEGLIKEIIHSGYHKAAKAFSSLSKTEVDIESHYLKFSDDPKDLIPLLEHKGPLIVLTTDIIGDIKGKSYLVLSGEESEKIIKACSPMKISEGQLDLSEAILLELDNILSASVITEISNKLKVMIYGDVPYIHRFHLDEFRQMLTRDFHTNQRSKSDLLLISSTFFRFANDTELLPRFIWKFGHNFLKSIKEASVNNGIIL